MTESHQRNARELSLAMLELINQQAFRRLGEVFHDDVVMDWPQSGERVRGLENAIHVFEEYPGGGDLPTTNIEFVEGDEGAYVLTPMFTMVKAEGQGNIATSTVKTRYPDGSDWHIVNIVRARDGKIERVTQYFGPEFEAPEWRARYVERMPAGECA